MNRRRLAHFVLLAALALPVAAPALAQSNLTDVASAMAIDANGERAIREYAEKHLAGLKSATPREVRNARQALLEPLGAKDVSIAFRNKYASFLIDDLRVLSTGANEASAVSAIVVAGEMATTASVNLIRDGLKDKRPGVRYASARAIGRMCQVVGKQSSPSVLAGDVERAIKDLGTFAAAQTENQVVTGSILALVSASEMKQRDLQSAGVAALSEALTAQSKGEPNPERVTAITPGVRALRDAALRNELNDTAYLAAGGAAGDVLAMSARLIKGGKADAGALNGVVNSAENALGSSYQGLTKSNSPDTGKLGELMLAGKTDQFLKELPKSIGPSGLLVKPPFDFKASRFAY